MEIIKIQYLEPYYEKRIGYFKGLDSVRQNFSILLCKLYEKVHNELGITEQDFYENLIQMINEHSDKIKVLEVFENV